jgi:hypothetical protein
VPGMGIVSNREIGVGLGPVGHSHKAPIFPIFQIRKDRGAVWRIGGFAHAVSQVHHTEYFMSRIKSAKVGGLGRTLAGAPRRPATTEPFGVGPFGGRASGELANFPVNLLRTKEFAACYFEQADF